MSNVSSPKEILKPNDQPIATRDVKPYFCDLESPKLKPKIDVRSSFERTKKPHWTKKIAKKMKNEASKQNSLKSASR
jgi:hypothetical protein